MAACSQVWFKMLMICYLYLLLCTQASINLDLNLPDIRMLKSCKINKIYQLGDSISDTGNRGVENPLDGCSKPPYGQSFSQGPTGRCSDGLLMIDDIALAAGIPLLNPYLKSNANFKHGVDFAVGGSTALSAHTLAKKNIILSGTKSSLIVQLEWMSNYLTSECSTEIDCSPESLKDALFMVGTTGGNDYNFALVQGKTTDEAESMVPEIVQTIMEAVTRVIGFGAVRIVVPGNFPMGCFPISLAMFKSNNESAYDEHQCLKDLNDLATLHNDYLQQAIITLQQEYPNIRIVYADYYNAFKWLLNNAPHIGIDATTSKGCCGNRGTSSFSGTEGCGSANVSVCSNPDQYISWDGVHMTQKAYRVQAKWLVADFLPKLNCDVQISDHKIKHVSSK